MGRHAHHLPDLGWARRFLQSQPHQRHRVFPRLGPALTELTEGRDLILDGEIIAPDLATGAPSFARLQQRMHLQRPSLELRRAVQLFVFDVLDIDGENTMALPYIERRARLTDLELSGPAVRTPPYWTGIPGRRHARCRGRSRTGRPRRQATRLELSPGDAIASVAEVPAEATCRCDHRWLGCFQRRR